MTVIALIVAGLLYYSGSSARIANAYTAVAAPADQALTAEVNGYTHNQRHHLAAARSDLGREAKTEAAFDGQLALVTFRAPPVPPPMCSSRPTRSGSS